MSVHRTHVVLLATTLLAVCCVAAPRPAHAAYPGGNGRIAFARVISSSPQRSSIFTATSTGRGVKQITFGHFDFRPVWSPNGRRIAFVRGTWSSPSHRDIYTVAATGGPVTRITTSSGDELDPSWSPDGKYLIFTSQRNVAIPNDDPETRTNIYRLRSTEPFGTAVKLNTPAIAGCGGQTPGQAAEPSWGSNSFIAFRACDAQTGDFPWAIYQMQPDGSEVKQLVSCPSSAGLSDCRLPDWSPLGRAISYTKEFVNDADRIDRSVVYQYTPATNTTKRVSPSTANWFYDGSAWSPRGTQIAFAGRVSGGISNIYVTSAAGLNLHLIIANGSDPSWQPIP